MKQFVHINLMSNIVFDTRSKFSLKLTHDIVYLIFLYQ